MKGVVVNAARRAQSEGRHNRTSETRIFNMGYGHRKVSDVGKNDTDIQFTRTEQDFC